jgi:caspase domain-containing protein
VQIKRIVALGIGAFLAIAAWPGRAEQSDPALFSSAHKSALAKATDECRKLWADPVFDQLRDKVPLGSHKPTMQMLTSSARLDPKDRPMADRAMKVVEQCRTAYNPAYAMLSEATRTLIEGLYREEDALIAQLYVGKITFGEFNVAENRLAGEIFRAFSGTPASSERQADGPAPVISARDTRLALVIGNSKYTNLAKLANPSNDAEAIANALGKMGYAPRLLLDASEQELRREIRKFAAESNKADVALVFYAGHGAQLNGENYLLPADIDIPQTEADIQLSGLKVDDLVNSIRSNTKIVFLDACRDNPALFKNLAKGRGGRAAGLAPTVGSSLDRGKPGGGIFIAYATDSGSIAADGAGKHSPFTQALLRYLRQPVSIDDMFSLVTKEVLMVTNNAQRPYKYASLESIVCLTGPCPGSAPAATVPIDLREEIKRSEAEELQIALRANSAEALRTYLQKYPESTRRWELLGTIAQMRRAESTEWTLYEMTDPRLPQFIKLSSIKQFGDKVAVETRALIDSSASGKKYPEGSYGESLFVVDCNRPRMAAAESRVTDPVGKVLYAYKWAAPQFLDLSRAPPIVPGSVAASTRRIACDEAMRTPLFDKRQLAEMNFTSLSSNPAGDGDMFYGPIQDEPRGQKEVTLINRFHRDRPLELAGGPVPGVPDRRIEASRIKVNCNDGAMTDIKSEYYDSANRLVYLHPYGQQLPESANSPLALLRRIVCNVNEADK